MNHAPNWTVASLETSGDLPPSEYECGGNQDSSGVVLNDESDSDASPVGVVPIRQTGASLGYLITQCVLAHDKGDMNASHEFFHRAAQALVWRGSHV